MIILAIKKYQKIIFLFIFFSSTFVYSQSSNDCYLLYVKDFHARVDQQTKEPVIDTVLRMESFVWRHGKKWFINGVFEQYNFQIQIDFKTIGDRVFFSHYGKDAEGIILGDSLLKMPKTKFAFVPLKKGAKVNPLKGQLSNQGDGWKILFEQDSILRRKKLYIQEGCAIFLDPLMPTMQCSKIIYRGEEQNNAIVAQGLFSVIQVFGISKTTALTSLYPWHIRANTTRIVEQSNSKLEPYPDNTIETKVQSGLLGQWETKMIYKFGLADLEPLPYTYDFDFRKDGLIIKKDYKGLKFMNRSDTLIYRLNPSGEYFNINRGRSRTEVSQLLIHKLERNTLTLVMDEIWVTEDGRGNIAGKVLIELKRK